MSRRKARVDSRRRNRSRPTPKWLKASGELDPIARSRCLMVLSVLSGEKPVTDAITEVGISRAAYYQIETRALSAMLRALAPNAVEETDEASPQRRVLKLERKVKLLEQGKRRAERLLLMTRRVLGPVKTRSTTSGRSPSRSSRKRKKSPAAKPSQHPSMPGPTGVVGP